MTRAMIPKDTNIVESTTNHPTIQPLGQPTGYLVAQYTNARTGQGNTELLSLKMLTNVNKRCNGKHKSHLTAYLHANNNFLSLLENVVAVDMHDFFFYLLS